MSSSTERLYYTDSYLREFRARVVERIDDGRRIVLDRTAFYPASGGQPSDAGFIGGVPVVDVMAEDDGRIVHVVERPVEQNEPDCAIDWARRWDHMQQHTGQHLLSAVLFEQFGIPTVSFHMGAASSTIDLGTSSLTAEQLEAAEFRANQAVQENNAVLVSFEDATAVEGLRKASQRTGELRIVTIGGLDRSACGGTHVRTTGEIGPVLLRGVDKIRGNVRLEFLCGMRAVRQMRAEFNALVSAARAFSAQAAEVPVLVAGAVERLKDADKARRKLETELATLRGQALHGQIQPNARGLRIAEVRVASGPLGDEVRNEANAFAACGKAIYVAVSDAPGSVLLAASSDSGIHCGNLLKQLLTEFSGRGGGAATLAQGSFPGAASASLLSKLHDALLGAV